MKSTSGIFLHLSISFSQDVDSGGVQTAIVFLMIASPTAQMAHEKGKHRGNYYDYYVFRISYLGNELKISPSPKDNRNDDSLTISQPSGHNWI